MGGFLGQGIDGTSARDSDTLDKIIIVDDFEPLDLCYDGNKVTEIIFRQKEYLTKTRESIPIHRKEIKTDILLTEAQATAAFARWWETDLDRGVFYFEADIKWFGKPTIMPVQIISDIKHIKVGSMNRINVIMRLMNFDIYAGHTRVYELYCGGTITCSTELLC